MKKKEAKNSINLRAQIKSIARRDALILTPGSFKYRAVAIENWRAFRRRYFSPRGITEETDNILRRLLSIFALARAARAL